jgi:uncharacterized membrane protein YebE (DUF533 family)
MAMFKSAFCFLSVSVVSVGFSNLALAQNLVKAHDEFQEVFVTAGYAAAFGALAGAALLPFYPEPPMGGFRFVAGCASLGFLGGSVYSFYRMNTIGQQQSDDVFASDDSYYQGQKNAEPIPLAIVGGSFSEPRFGIPAVAVGKNGFQIPVALMSF